MELKNATALVFPLNLVAQKFDKYFITREGQLYSTKQVKDGRALHGSLTYGRHNHLDAYHTIAGNSYKAGDILRTAKQHGRFVSEVSKAGSWAADQELNDMTEVDNVEVMHRDMPQRDANVKDRAHAKTLDEGLKAKGYVIGKVASYNGENFLQFGSKPAIHLTLASRNAEMNRLATAQPGVKFVAVKIDATIVAGAVVWS